MAFRCLTAALALAVGTAAAQPASDLLQSAIYHQETAGNLDAAIRIYRQILNSPELKVYAAQAQYRLGICLLRQGDIGHARQALESVLRDYPHEKELAARAREVLPTLGNGLLPAPWRDGEVADYRWTIPGVENAWMMTSVHATDSSTLRIQNIFYTPALFFTTTDVDSRTMAPISAAWRSGPNITSRTYVRNQSGAAGTIYDYGEMLQLLRRMPIAPGWSQTIRGSSPSNVKMGVRMPPAPGWSQTIQGSSSSHAKKGVRILPPSDGNDGKADSGASGPFKMPASMAAAVELRAAVTGTETVKVPAGTFECYRVQISAGTSGAQVLNLGPGPELGDTLWYGVNGARPLVKIERFGTMRGELVSLGVTDPKGTRSYRDPRAGYSFAVPPGWLFHPRAAFSGTGDSVDLVDPDSHVWSVISGRAQVTAREEIAKQLEDGADARLRQSVTIWRDYKIRPGSRRRWTLGGHMALSWIADYAESGRPFVEYITWVQSEAARASLVAQTDAAEFEANRQRFDVIVNSFRIP